jgi:hypothetical protein
MEEFAVAMQRAREREGDAKCCAGIADGWAKIVKELEGK